MATPTAAPETKSGSPCTNCCKEIALARAKPPATKSQFFFTRRSIFSFSKNQSAESTGIISQEIVASLFSLPRTPLCCFIRRSRHNEDRVGRPALLSQWNVQSVQRKTQRKLRSVQ